MNGLWLVLAHRPDRPAKVAGAAESISTNGGRASASAGGVATALAYLVVCWMFISVTNSDVEGSPTNEAVHRLTDE